MIQNHNYSNSLLRVCKMTGEQLDAELLVDNVKFSETTEQDYPANK